MRGSDTVRESLFSYMDLETRVRAEHPLRLIREIVNATLKALSAEFDALYSPFGRESIPPERLLRALLLQAFYPIRSERQLVERLEFDLLFRWFVGLGVDDPVWDATTFTKNRDRLLAGDQPEGGLASASRSGRTNSTPPFLSYLTPPRCRNALQAISAQRMKSAATQCFAKEAPSESAISISTALSASLLT